MSEVLELSHNLRSPRRPAPLSRKWTEEHCEYI